MQKLHAPSAGLALGLTEAFALALMALLAATHGYGLEFVNAMQPLIPWYEASATGVFSGIFWGVLDGFIGGFILASLYNWSLTCNNKPAKGKKKKR